MVVTFQSAEAFQVFVAYFLENLGDGFAGWDWTDTIVLNSRDYQETGCNAASLHPGIVAKVFE